jgi:flagellar assembly protein FliH
MSSSDLLDPSLVTGRVHMNLTGPGPAETTIQELEGKKRLVWDDAVSEEYMERIRDKAREAARQILAEAMREAEDIREKARREGYAEGMAQADQDNRETLQRMSENLGQALAAIQHHGRAIVREQRLDLAALIRVAVEKTLGVEYEPRRGEVVQGLLEEALERVDARRGLVIRVTPRDFPMVEKLMNLARENRPDLSQWRLKADLPEPGGVVVESEDGLADNGLPARWQAVESVFDRLAEVLAAGDGPTDGHGDGSLTPEGGPGGAPGHGA